MLNKTAKSSFLEKAIREQMQIDNAYRSVIAPITTDKVVKIGNQVATFKFGKYYAECGGANGN